MKNRCQGLASQILNLMSLELGPHVFRRNANISITLFIAYVVGRTVTSLDVTQISVSRCL